MFKNFFHFCFLPMENPLKLVETALDFVTLARTTLPRIPFTTVVCERNMNKNGKAQVKKQIFLWYKCREEPSPPTWLLMFSPTCWLGAVIRHTGSVCGFKCAVSRARHTWTSCMFALKLTAITETRYSETWPLLHSTARIRAHVSALLLVSVLFLSVLGYPPI